MDEAVSGGFCTRVGAKCGRWNPTAEQVKVLTDLFSAGLRTPTTEQIQRISSHLGAFGKIESKNVFYWFQNHKARERHHKKRRRGTNAAARGDVCVVVTPDSNKIKEARNCREFEQEAVRIRREREIETLELFPSSSYNECEKARNNQWREMISFTDITGRDPPLDLRLSFL